MGFWDSLFNRQQPTEAPEQPSLAAPKAGGPRVAPSNAPPAPWRTASASPTSQDFIAVVGESHYQDGLRTMSEFFTSIGRDERTFEAHLVPEPSNPYDGNAVAVTFPDGSKIGYLSRDVAKDFHARIVRYGKPVTCPARLTGSVGQNIGVVLDFIEVRKLK